MGPAPTPEPERFWPKVDLSGPGCWLWTAGTNRDGYGSFRVGSQSDGTRRHVLAHRWAYEHLVGPIPEGLTIDHLCRVRHCVNPDHLEPVSHAENTRRGESGRNQRIKTHCPQGHPYDEENTYMWNDHRYCRACQRARRAMRP